MTAWLAIVIILAVLTVAAVVVIACWADRDRRFQRGVTNDFADWTDHG